MRIYDENFTPTQTKLMKWAMPIIQAEFNTVKYVFSNSQRFNSIIFAVCAEPQHLENFCEKLNHFPTIRARVWYNVWHDSDNSVGINIGPTNFWQEDFREETFGFIRRCACNNKIPLDTKLRKYLGGDVIPFTEGGFGIEGKYQNHKINFTIEEWSDGVYEYCAEWDGYHIYGLASSTTLSIGKTLAAIYKSAQLHCPEVAVALEGGLFKFHSYGYCH